MRIGNYKSDSYKRLQARKYARKKAVIAKLCKRLDALVERAEAMAPGRVRAGLLGKADVVRERLRFLEY
jgi:hypothetical protein